MGQWRAGAVAVEVHGPIGDLIVVHHNCTFELKREDIRERGALPTARFIEDVRDRRDDLPVVLLGHFNAGPDTASIRVLTGRQSLHGFAVRYEDAWEAVHGVAPGLTFDPRNPLVRAGQMPLERGRRVDHILVRSRAYGPLLDVADCRMVARPSRRSVAERPFRCARRPAPTRPTPWQVEADMR